MIDKSVFDADSITNTASELKYTNQLKVLFNQEINNPSPDFVKYFAKQVYPNNISSKVLEQFTNLLKKSMQQYISDIITERLKTALTKEDEKVKEEEAKQLEQSKQESKIVTTEEELEGFLIVKTILRQRIKAERITYRDAQTYFTVVLDDNNRKTVCRLYLGGSKKYFVTLDEQKKEVRNEISTVDDIFKYSELLIKIAESF